MSETTVTHSNTLQIMNKHLANLFFWEHGLQFEQNQGTWFQRQVSKIACVLCLATVICSNYFVLIKSTRDQINWNNVKSVGKLRVPSSHYPQKNPVETDAGNISHK